MSSSRQQRGHSPQRDNRHDSSSKKGTILTIKSSEKDPSMRDGSAAGQMSAKSKFNRHLLAQTQARQASQEKSQARDRWSILKEAIFNRSSSIKASAVSVRRFDSFGFLQTEKIDYNPSAANNYPKPQSRGANNHRFYHTSTNVKNTNYVVDASDSDDDDDVCVANKSSDKSNHRVRVRNSSSSSDNFEWYNISVPSVLDEMENVKVRFYKGPVGLKDMMGFNNTGNVCLWPSEEVMTYFCVKNSVIFDDKSVCELGGGMTCLAGLMISRCSQPSEVFLTDGNESSFENLEVICSDNEFRCSVECCLLQWSKDTNYGDLENRFDYIICADCLFFDEFREDLCTTIWKLLRMDGTCLIFAPNRQNTFHKFVDMAKLHFECMIVHDYDMEVWERHLYEKENNPDYDEDLHYPLLLKLKKRKKTTNDFCKMVL